MTAKAVKLLTDIAERTTATYLQALVGLLLVGNVIDLSAVRAAAVAAVPAALAVLKGAVAALMSNGRSASLFPAKTAAVSPPPEAGT